MADDTLETPVIKETADDISEETKKKKTDIASADEYVINTFLNEQLALIDEQQPDVTNFGMKIITFFIPKFNKGKDFYDSKNAVNIPYSSLVKQIVLEDSLDSIGLSGYVDIVNEGGVLDGILERHNLFYLVINMTEYVSDGVSIKYEPYIFDITKSYQTSLGNKSGSRVIRIHLVDIITSILRSHSIASFIKFSGTDITKCRNYKYLFNKVIEYVRRFIKINFDNSLEFKKDVIFGEEMLYKGEEKLNGYDVDLTLGELVTHSFNKIDRNASIWEAMTVFLKDCVTSIKLNDSIKQIFQDIGDVLIPFFFKEEYGDYNGIYTKAWRDSNKLPLDSTTLVNNDFGGKSVGLVYRNITMRDFFMPFYLCFSQKVPHVFQEINKGKSQVFSMDLPIVDNLQSLKFTTIDKAMVDKRWKNVIFIDPKNSATNCTLVFFDWFYRFFLRVFLNSEKMGGKQKLLSNVIPDFYLFSLLHGVGYAKNNNEKDFDNLFDEYNSYTFATKTNDTTNEALREMGKNLASLVLLNDSYSFTLQGNIRRRPNEIIKLNVGELMNGQESQIPLYTNLNQDSSIFVYVRKVTHIFKGHSYVNEITASKICESYD